MKDIEYSGNLVEDIKLSKKKFNIFSTFLKICLIQFFLTGIAGVVGVFVTKAAFSTFVVNTFPLIVATIWGSAIPIDILVIKKLKSNFEKRKVKAKNRLFSFSENIKNKENIDVATDDLQKAQIEKTVTDIKHYQNGKLKSTSSNTTNRIYCLDRNAQILALMAIRKEITNKQGRIGSVKKVITNNLQLYEQEDIKREKITNRLARTLKFKSKN